MKLCAGLEIMDHSRQSDIFIFASDEVFGRKNSDVLSTGARLVFPESGTDEDILRFLADNVTIIQKGEKEQMTIEAFAMVGHGRAHENIRRKAVRILGSIPFNAHVRLNSYLWMF